ncbi:MAG: hypothetical protein M1497_00690 [Nitrospirae bacterium]|nr:hypothetical protein [Nitrospirota bacterium]
MACLKSLRVLLIVVGIIAFIAPMTAEAVRTMPPSQPPSQGGVPPGQPFQNLQNQINALKTLINDNLIGNHHIELTFDLDPGASFSFPLPKKQSPVRIEVTVSRMNGGTQTPTEIMYAVVNQDPVSNEMTWIGTNSDGSVVATNTLDSTDDVIAVICGGACPTYDDRLLVNDLSDSTVKIESNAATVSVKSSYVVHLWF